MREGENERIFIRNAEVGLPDFFTNTELRIINKMKKKTNRDRQDADNGDNTCKTYTNSASPVRSEGGVH